MGQIYHACIYDIENKLKCVMDADKFHANCYSFSGTVVTTHYLLRQKPHNVMWGGGYIALGDALADVHEEHVLMGISTYTSHDTFESNDEDITQKPYYGKVKFIDEQSKTWERISVLDEAWEHFDMEHKDSVPYIGYLLNHTKKLAVDLADYNGKSLFLSGKKHDTLMAIDPIPVLTEIGNRSWGGPQMAYLRGVSAESTEELAGTWNGDLLQIVDNLPDGFDVINCAFVDIMNRADYCYEKYGLTEEGLIKDGDSMYKVAPLNIAGIRGELRYVKVEIAEDKMTFSTVPIE